MTIQTIKCCTRYREKYRSCSLERRMRVRKDMEVEEIRSCERCPGNDVARTRKKWTRKIYEKSSEE